ncbi:hypothetical protein [Gracilimonas mengyeensis]|uniref:Uncharacterized protein n=1 Tax=Gracilimonas mengyeensis TaxID=1302730 RepID=A0A521ELS9_9BACT|nr:hypothetical protein [Gracilimonas mengyeensis]SMO84876.1 hypothetical protein SAMN06265219_112143 [Gracilimonas mengyeensis]
MITAHLIKNDKESSRLKEKLDDLVISYKTEWHAEDASDSPWIEEDGVHFKTKDEQEQWLQQLQNELNWQRSLSGDGCYIDPKKGTVC